MNVRPSGVTATPPATQTGRFGRGALARLVTGGLLGTLSLATAEGAPSGCGQQITFLGVSAGDPPIAWVTEDIGGACRFSFLIQIGVEPDTVRASVSPLDRHADWEWLIRGQSVLRPYAPPEGTSLTEDGSAVADTTGGVGVGTSGDAIAGDSPVIRHRRPPDTAPSDRLPEVVAPPPSDDWHAKFLAHLDAGGSDAVSWNAEMGRSGLLPPIVDGVEAEVLYAYPHGLYVNYDVSHVERLPHGHLLVLTTQPALGLHNNTMHGLLVLRARR